jgi:hypothetical protein
MPVITNHPNWKVCLTLDRFSSVLVPETLPVFTDAKIEVVKEEGNTSAVNQPYDQSVAKMDKEFIRSALESCQSIQIINQETIVGACIHALGKVEPKAWVCVCVNLSSG